jgi:thiamine-phosphate pyrophosphorylase
VRAIAAEIGLPWFAIGGINAANVAEVMGAGAMRIAISGTVCGADDPGAIASELKRRLQIANCELQIAN